MEQSPAGLARIFLHALSALACQLDTLGDLKASGYERSFDVFGVPPGPSRLEPRGLEPIGAKHL